MTNTKNNFKPQLVSRPASLDQIWTCLQRILYFEEPDSRWERLLTQLSKSVNVKIKDMMTLSLSKQQNIFNEVFSSANIDNSILVFNILLALLDLEKFDSSLFDVWHFAQKNDDLDNTFTNSDRNELNFCFENSKNINSDLLYLLAKEAVLTAEQLKDNKIVEPTDGQIAWLKHSLNAVPDWRVLQSAGPWSDDLMAQFISQFMTKLDSMKVDICLESIVKAKSILKKDLFKWRKKLPKNFQPSIIVLVEGQTELILLSRFIEINKTDSFNHSIYFLPCGGANQVWRKYVHLCDRLRIPIIAVVDHDAQEQAEEIRAILRDSDSLHIWQQGEIEDTFPLKMFRSYLNQYLEELGNVQYLKEEELTKQKNRIDDLNRAWRLRQLGDFDKVGFASFLAKSIKHQNELPSESKTFLETIDKTIFKLESNEISN